jgi:hypothetical protein
MTRRAHECGWGMCVSFFECANVNVCGQYDPPKGWAEQEGPPATDADLSDLASAASELQALVYVAAGVQVLFAPCISILTLLSCVYFAGLQAALERPRAPFPPAGSRVLCHPLALMVVAWYAHSPPLPPPPARIATVVSLPIVST